MDSNGNRSNDSIRNATLLGPNFSMYDQSSKMNLLNKIQMHVKIITDKSVTSPEEEMFLRDIELFIDKVEELY